jgi:uncharacterized protein
LFGSVARGDSTAAKDIFVDLDPDGGNPLLRVADIPEELRELLGVPVDVVTEAHLARTAVSHGSRQPRRALSRKTNERFGDTLNAIDRQ